MENIKVNEEDTAKEYQEMPKHRSFNLYVILTCGLIIFFYGVYSKFFDTDKTPQIWFDGDVYHKGVIDGFYFVVVGLLICIFPIYHLIKRNHKFK